VWLAGKPDSRKELRRLREEVKAAIKAKQYPFERIKADAAEALE
jgi:hypothetical protein